MSSNNLTSVLKSCSEGELMNEEEIIVPKQNETIKLKRTFTLPRNPFSSSSKPLLGSKIKNDVDSKTESGSNSNECVYEEGTIERKLFRRPSWKRFINKIAQHMNTVGANNTKPPAFLANNELVQGEPPWPPGTTPAVTGLRNHGNTCYMNAVLQCLSHTDVIAEYFVLDHYKVDLLKRNKLNSKKYGTKGEVTDQLAMLLKALWSCQYIPDMSVAFKSTVERHGTQYKGNSQHDAQEFLFWLLDKVHEDLNTATKKKYKAIKNNCGKPDEVVAAETLANHARRNSSFVQAVFQAQYRSALQCKSCSRRSCTFDPFHCVSVQLPSAVQMQPPGPVSVSVVYMNQQPRQVKIGIQVNKDTTMEDLKKILHSDTGIEMEQIILAEISSQGWHRPRAHWEYAGVDSGHLYCIEAPQLICEPTTPYILVMWVNLLNNQRFGSPYAMQVPRETSYEDLQKLILKEMSGVVAERILTTNQHCKIFRARLAHLPSDSIEDDLYLQPDLPHPLYATSVERVVGFEGLSHLQLELLWDEAYRDSIMLSIEENFDVHVSCTPPPLTLSICLQHYTREEMLAHDDAWRCPQCETYMPVIKTLGLWSLPDVLVIHLKRFRQLAKGKASSKLTTMVEFPLTDFDMTPHLVQRNNANESPGHSRSPWKRTKTSNNTHDNLYDLYAVCYHHGDNLETGHYTATCKNPYDGFWYKFDDARVTRIDDDDPRSELVNNEAYMLFYKRKKPSIIHTHSYSNEKGHWALRMSRFTKKSTATLIEEIHDTDIELQSAPIDNEISENQSVSLSQSIASLPDDTVMSPKPHHTTLLDNSTMEINGNNSDCNSIYGSNSLNEGFTIHKDVYINPKMTPAFSNSKEVIRPRSVDYPNTSLLRESDIVNRNYESSPYVASINGIEYDNGVSNDAQTTEDLVLSMFRNETKILTRFNRDRNGEKQNSLWKARIST